MTAPFLILHDYFESLEGGGRLCSLLAHHRPSAIAYGFAKENHPFLQGINRQHNLHANSNIPLWRQFKLARAFQQRTVFIKDYDTLLYSGFYTPLAVVQHPHARHFLYCHTPPRFIYDQYDFYLSQTPRPLRFALQAFIRYLQPRYETAINNMTQILTNSHNVQKRIQHYLGKPATVIYPPCDTKQFKWLAQGDYYLSLARLDPLKRVDKIIQAFLKMPDKRLIVASGGQELGRLRNLANGANNIQLTGWLEERALQSLLGNAIATLYLAKDEDFGMSPVESMAAGKPVIGVAEGGLVESILPERTGLLLPADFTIEMICDAVCTLSPANALDLRKACEQQAKKFDITVFLQAMDKIIYKKTSIK
ncbi:glycosyltransferase [Beggiatoa leptomitoformis]|uniref:Glycosyltransferase n=1 Tax=Beggiatoa leptomitoformis TaxID=288004 RepID=A0A2N9YF85_9GAMM|nr:glycosyltransferase [Beggiatoa leptomitoformis]ALG68483.1 glycosyltransferase [Beggiatoa leptomitoformis]AUI69181.1 glycosyltransferase [Beggiatoa leptomitoformis]